MSEEQTDENTIDGTAGAGVALDTFVAIYSKLRMMDGNPATDVELITGMLAIIAKIIQAQDEPERAAQMLEMSVISLRKWTLERPPSATVN